MVEISEIEDKKSLRAWLDGLPSGTEEEAARRRQIAVTVASRSALRVMPLWWQATAEEDVLQKEGLTPLPVLRSLLISLVAA